MTPTPTPPTSGPERFIEDRYALSLPLPRPLTLKGTTYEFLQLLSRRGGREVTWLAQRRLGQEPAGRVTVTRVRNPSLFVHRIRTKETALLSLRLHHPALLQTLQAVVHDGEPLFVQEHVDGPCLDTVVSAAVARGQPVSPGFALFVGSEVAEALHHAHTLKDEAGRPLGVVHRDVCPRNIWVDQATGAVKLGGFGSAYWLLVGREETPASLLRGDVAYAAPEYFERRWLNARSDVFSLGVTLVELLTGQHPFDAEEPGVPSPSVEGRLRTEERPSLPLRRMRALMAGYGEAHVRRAVEAVPPALQPLLAQVLQKAPDARPASAGALRDALRAQLAAQAPAYGRAEAAEELGRLLADATVIRARAQFAEAGLWPEGLDSHELPPDASETDG